MILRAYRSADCPHLAALFFDTVHTVCAGDYTEAQRWAWAPGSVDLAQWNHTLSAHVTRVAEADGILVGFGDMADTGYLNRLYVHRAYLRRGIATALCAALEEAVDAELFYTYASLTAHPFFLRQGYRVVQTQTVVRNGICLRNHRMEKPNPKKEGIR